MTELYDNEYEIWVSVSIDGKDYPGYLVSSEGRIYSLKTNSIMTGTHSHNGYIRVKLRDKSGNPIMKPKHRIVAERFCSNPDNKPFVNHIDGNKENNHPTNLEWVTAKENTKHAIDTGLIYTVGEKSHFASINEKTAHNICKLIDKGIKLKDIARLLNVGYDCVKKINSGKSWKHISSQYNFLNKL